MYTICHRYIIGIVINDHCHSYDDHHGAWRHLGQLVHHTDQQGGHCQHHRQIHLVSVLCVNVNVRFTELEVRAKEDF